MFSSATARGRSRRGAMKAERLDYNSSHALSAQQKHPNVILFVTNVQKQSLSSSAAACHCRRSVWLHSAAAAATLKPAYNQNYT